MRLTDFIVALVVIVAHVGALALCCWIADKILGGTVFHRNENEQDFHG